MKMILSLIILASLNNVQASNLSQFFTTNANTTSGRVVFDRDSTWTVPAGVTKINVEIIGGGGGGAEGSGNSGGGGGGGGSCIKNGVTTLASADGGRGAHYNETQAQPGGVTRSTLTVVAGTTLNVYLGGGGGSGGYSSGQRGGGGGYGFCGVGGAGGNVSNAVGGAGATDKGGGGGAAAAVAGGSASTSTGATGATIGGAGGTALIGGDVGSTSAGGGGASGGVGGAGGYYDGSNLFFYGTSGKYAANIHSSAVRYSTYPCNYAFSVLPGSPGVRRMCLNLEYGAFGGGGGGVIISW